MNLLRSLRDNIANGACLKSGTGIGRGIDGRKPVYESLHARMAYWFVQNGNSEKCELVWHGNLNTSGSNHPYPAVRRFSLLDLRKYLRLRRLVLACANESFLVQPLQVLELLLWRLLLALGRCGLTGRRCRCR